MNKINIFPKKEHLCGEIRIGNLFAEGKAFIAYPLRVVYKYEFVGASTPILVMISAPKKRFKKAVHCNRIKRLMRESYRLNKHGLIDFCTENATSLQISLAYVANSELPFDAITESVKIALSKIQIRLQELIIANNSSK